MDEHDEKLMAQYGITAETKIRFHFDGHRYDRLTDAVNYARLQQSQLEEDSVSMVPGHEN